MLQDEDGPNFMETPINIEDYLNVGDEYSPDHRFAIEDDFFEKSGPTVISEFRQNDDVFGTPQGDHSHQVLCSPVFNEQPGSFVNDVDMLQLNNVNVKPETVTPDADSSTAFFHGTEQPAVQVEPVVTVYKPKTAARKYRRKPSEEKHSMHYKVKREKNNDAVRKSRSKSKQLQQLRDDELARLTDENSQLHQKFADSRLQIKALVKENENLKSRLRAHGIQ